jgi:hypothetical protein
MNTSPRLKGNTLQPLRTGNPDSAGVGGTRPIPGPHRPRHPGGCHKGRSKGKQATQTKQTRKQKKAKAKGGKKGGGGAGDGKRNARRPRQNTREAREEGGRERRGEGQVRSRASKGSTQSCEGANPNDLPFGSIAKPPLCSAATPGRNRTQTGA